LESLDDGRDTLTVLITGFKGSRVLEVYGRCCITYEVSVERGNVRGVPSGRISVN